MCQADVTNAREIMRLILASTWKIQVRLGLGEPERVVKPWRQDIQPNGSRKNDMKPNVIQLNDIWPNAIQPNGIQPNDSWQNNTEEYTIRTVKYIDVFFC